jgi:hypothetical protein
MRRAVDIRYRLIANSQHQDWRMTRSAQKILRRFGLGQSERRKVIVAATLERVKELGVWNVKAR